MYFNCQYFCFTLEEEYLYKCDFTINMQPRVELRFIF